MLFGHGDDTYRYGDQVKMNFSSNIYQKADLTGLKEHLSSHLDVIRHYPAPVAQELEESHELRHEPEGTSMGLMGL